MLRLKVSVMVTELYSVILHHSEGQESYNGSKVLLGRRGHVASWIATHWGPLLKLAHIVLQP